MIFFRSLLPGNTPAQVKDKDDIEVLKEKSLQTLYLIMLAVGTIAFTLFTYINLESQQRFLIFLSGGLLGIFMYLGINRRLPLNARSLGLILSFYLLAIWLLNTKVGWTSGFVLLIPPVILSVVFLGKNQGVIFTILSAVILLLPNSFPYNEVPYTKILIVAGYILIVALLNLFISNFIQNLQSSLANQRMLSKKIEFERRSLERKFEQRSEDLERRLLQIRTAADISRSITSILNLQELLQLVVDLLVERAKLYYAGVFLIDSSGKFAALKAGSGEAGNAMVSEGHRLEVGGTSMIGWTTSKMEPRIALDVGNEAVRFNNPHLPLTRSELSIPIISQGTILGAISIQSTSPNAFDENDILIFQGVADSLATAIRNAQLFEQNQKDIEEIRSLNRQFLKDAWKDVLDIHGTTLAYTHDNPDIFKMNNGSGVVQIPINLREQIIGQITIETPKPSLTPQEMSTVEAILSQTALALENARLLEESQRHAAQEEKVNQLSAEFSRAMNVGEILKTAVKEIGRLPGITEAAIHLLPPENHKRLSEKQNGAPKNGHGQEKI